MSNIGTTDIIILGAGPAGLQAAIHAARRRVSVLVLGRAEKSSLFHAHIENLCCLFNVKGEEMLRIGRQQAEGFGAVIRDEDVLSLSSGDGGFAIRGDSGTTYRATALILATGTRRQRLGVPGEKELLGKGVSYCVECDGNFFRDQDICVLGGESAAVDAALILVRIARRVHLVFSALEVGEALARELKDSPVTIHEGVGVAAVVGDGVVEGLDLTDGTRLAVSGVFIEQGAKGVVELASALGMALDDEMKFLRTDKNQATSVAGVFAAGDICGPPWQVAKAVGEGCVAGVNAATYVKARRRTTAG